MQSPAGLRRGRLLLALSPDFGGISLSLAQTGRIDRLSGGLCRSSDFEAIAERMAKVFGAGLDAMKP